MNDHHNFSYWEQKTFLKPYDVIVVGAGIVGLASALYFKKAQPEARVMVLEKGLFPAGASTRNAGFVCVGSITEHVADMQKESEEEIKKRLKARYEGSELLLKTLGKAAIGYEPCGGYELFTSPESFETAAGYISTFNKWMKELTGEEEAYRADTLNGYHVIYNRLEGAIHPGKMMDQFIRLIIQEGIEIKWNCPVNKVKPDGRVILEGNISFQARKVLIATNGFVKKLLPEIPILPARGYIFVTNELNEMPWQGTFHHDRGYIYFRNIGNRLLIGGARNIAVEEEETDQFGINERIKAHLVDFVSDVLRLSSGWRVDYKWSGIMGFTPTKTPMVERVDGCRYIAAGLSGMGIAIGMDVGHTAAEMMDS